MDITSAERNSAAGQFIDTSFHRETADSTIIGTSAILIGDRVSDVIKLAAYHETVLKRHVCHRYTVPATGELYAGKIGDARIMPVRRLMFTT